MSALTESPVWSALTAHYARIANYPIISFFENDPRRFEKFSRQFKSILLDFSKQPLDDQVIECLLDLARQQKLQEWIERMFSGERINTTENRAALHIALRAHSPVYLDGVDVVPDVQAVLRKMAQFVAAVHERSYRGYSGLPVTDIVNIGIGGSDLGPAMVTEALKPYCLPQFRVHFVSNIDGAQLDGVLRNLDPATTLFIVASKTFTTQETLTNAHSARAWFLQNGGNETAIARHFVAVSTNLAAVRQFGITAENTFPFWDWVGGRYSLWSAIGLPIALAIGMDSFYALLAGAHDMDQHFLHTPLEANLPVLLGLIGIWQINFCQATSHVILPYDQSLHRFPAYLQQLEMESLGKRITRDGELVDYSTGVIVWGEPGTNGQHAFYQLLHQGTQVFNADFLAPCNSQHSLHHHHTMLLANFLAQTEALMRGKSAQTVRAELEAEGISLQRIQQLLSHRVFPGNRGTTSILFDKLDPHTLGTLIALYEHKVFVQSVIWNINPFDQWGVELGKQLANTILAELTNDRLSPEHDASTSGLMRYLQSHREL